MTDSLLPVIDALRSGVYQKGNTQLHYIDESGTHRYCCLGVICDINGYQWESYEDDIDVNLNSRHHMFKTTSKIVNEDGEYQHHTADLPQELEDKYQLRRQSHIWNLNDGCNTWDEVITYFFSLEAERVADGTVDYDEGLASKWQEYMGQRASSEL